MTKDDAAKLIDGLIDQRVPHISVHTSSNEVAGKLAKNGYSSIEYDTSKPGMRVFGLTGVWEAYTTMTEVWAVLATGEDWKPQMKTIVNTRTGDHTVGSQLCNLRQATAFSNADRDLIVKVGDQYYKVKRVWVDTIQAPVGEGVYLETHATPIR